MSKRYLTVLYRVEPGEDVQRIWDSGDEVVAMGWCDAFADRDEARAELERLKDK
jgi:hypothetical protein